MKKGKIILEATIIAIIVFVVFVVGSMRMVFAAILSIIFFIAHIVKQYIKYRLKKEREDEYK